MTVPHVSAPQAHVSAPPPIVTTDSPSTASPSPHIASKVGGHAAARGFHWNKPGEYHQYILKTGLPEVHAALLNGDIIYAEEILCEEDIGLQWHPPISQSQPRLRTAAQQEFYWPAALPSSNDATRQRAIVEMVIHLNDAAASPGTGCLYGANLVTFCLQLPAPATFTAKVIDLARRRAPHFLDLPDGSGRTPLYIAIEKNSADYVRQLLDAGADPFVNCRLLNEALPSAYDWALEKSTDEIVAMLLQKLISDRTDNQAYPVDRDPLGLQRWVARHDEQAVRTMMKQFPRLFDALSNYIDSSGSSMVTRQLARGEPAEARPCPWIGSSLEQSALHAAASGGNVPVFMDVLKTVVEALEGDDAVVPDITQTLRTLFLTCSPVDLIRALQDKGALPARVRRELIAELTSECAFPPERFLSLARAAWPLLSESEKREIFAATASYPAFCMEGVLAMLDVSLTFETVRKMRAQAALQANTAAWEFAADRSRDLGWRPNHVHGAKQPVFTGYLQEALMAGSLRWVEKILSAGTPLQDYLDSAADRLLPLLADLDPSGLSNRLAGCKISPKAIKPEACRTEEGRQALYNLRQRDQTLQ